MKRDGKSKNYPQVYWNNVKTPDGLRTERQYIIVYKSPLSGKQVEEVVGTSGEGMTEAKANLKRSDRIQGKEPSNNERRQAERQAKLDAGKPQNFDDLWQLYLEAHKDNASIKTDLGHIKNHISKFIGKKPIKEIKTTTIQAIRSAMEKQGLKPQTVKHGLGLIRRVLNYGVKMDYCEMPDKLHFIMPTVDNIKTENMDAEQLAKYLQALDEEEDQDAAAFLKLALVTGMRKGALCGLKWTDCDFEHDTITLRGEEAKSGKTEVIPMIEAAREILQSINCKAEYVFPGRDGGKRKDFKRIARRVREKAGLPADFRPVHGLRHTFASHMASSGEVDIYTLKDLLTHGSVAMTQRYAHLTDEAKRKAANVANILAGDKWKK